MGCCSCPSGSGLAAAQGWGDILIDSVFDQPYPRPVPAERYVPSFTRGGADAQRIAVLPQMSSPPVALIVILLAVVGYLWYQNKGR